MSQQTETATPLDEEVNSDPLFIGFQQLGVYISFTGYEFTYAELLDEDLQEKWFKEAKELKRPYLHETKLELLDYTTHILIAAATMRAHFGYLFCPERNRIFCRVTQTYYKVDKATQFWQDVKRLWPYFKKGSPEDYEMDKLLRQFKRFETVSWIHFNPTHLLNFQNGVYDTRTRKFSEPYEGLYFSYELPFDYCPEMAEEPTPYFDIFHETNPDTMLRLEQHVRNFLYHYIDDQMFPQLLGPKSCGKSTLIAVLAHCVRSMVALLDPCRLGERFGCQSLVGKRAMMCSELTLTTLSPKASSRQKEISAGDEFSVEIKKAPDIDVNGEDIYIFLAGNRPQGIAPTEIKTMMRRVDYLYFKPLTRLLGNAKRHLIEEAPIWITQLLLMGPAPILPLDEQERKAAQEVHAGKMLAIYRRELDVMTQLLREHFKLLSLNHLDASKQFSFILNKSYRFNDIKEQIEMLMSEAGQKLGNKRDLDAKLKVALKQSGARKNSQAGYALWGPFFAEALDIEYHWTYNSEVDVDSFFPAKQDEDEFTLGGV